MPPPPATIIATTTITTTTTNHVPIRTDRPNKQVHRTPRVKSGVTFHSPDEQKEKIGPAKPKAAPPLPPPPPSSVAPPPPPPQVKVSQSLAPPPPPQQQMVQPPPPSHPAMPPMQRVMGMPPQMMVIPPRPPVMMGMPRPPMMAPMGMNMQPGPPMMPPQMRPPGPPQPSMGRGLMGGELSEEPPSKKQKTEESLIPEDIFLQKNRGNVKLSVIVPKVPDKPEWNLKGQTLEYTLPITDAVSVIKAKLNESLSIPAGKQKLIFESMFIKDSNSLAFYNFLDGAQVQLQLKERGGRKK